MADIQAVIFDLYGTLIYLADEKKPYTKLFQDLGFQTPNEFRKVRRIALEENFENLASLVRRLKPNTQIDLTDYQQELEKELASATLYFETTDALSKLKNQKTRLGLISNLASPYKKPFFDLEINEYFDEMLFSCDVGLRKPDQRIYENIVEKFGISPSQALMIGDKFHADVDGPKSIGMNAVHLDRTHKSYNSSMHTLEEVFQKL